ncbi:MAG: family 16 glycoside hydrolase, partial [Bryobacteraceae bacterium]
MKRRHLLALALAAPAAFAKDGFKPLFNGKNLDGWEGDPRLWKVRDGMIVGSTEGVTLEGN